MNSPPILPNQPIRRVDQIVPVFDGHNDFLLRLWNSAAPDPIACFIEGTNSVGKNKPNGHIDLPRARKGGLAGGLCAVFVPSPSMKLDENGDYYAPSQQDALEATLAMTALLTRLESRSGGQLSICRNTDDISNAMLNDSFAAVLHIEGVEAIAGNLDALYVLHQAGLRSIGPVWSRPNIFAYGVPFRFPSSPDIGPGLSEHGKDLIRVSNQLKVMIDLSHMNEQGFWDVAAISDAPLVATHSNAHALCKHSRNLTDKQLDAIKASGGLVGINFGVIFAREDSQRISDTPLSELVRHIDYIADRIGIEHVAFGSDFDGTTIPDALGDASNLQLLISALRVAGYDDETIAKISYQNWMRVLKQSWA